MKRKTVISILGAAMILMMLATLFTAGDPKENLFKVNYDLGEYVGEGAPPKGIEVESEVTLPQVGVEWSEHEFTGWKADGEGELIMPGDVVAVTKDVTFVAQWESALPPPSDKIALFMYGDLYENKMRTIYAQLNGVEGNLNWESDNIEVVEVSDIVYEQGDMPEMFLTAKGVGKANIKCYLQSDPTIYAVYEIEVKAIDDGETLPKSIYDGIGGGVKVTSIDSGLVFNKRYNESVAFEDKLTNVYANTVIEGDPDLTDAFYFEAETDGVVSASYSFVNSEGYVARQSLDYHNRVVSERAKNSDGFNIAWNESIYFNPFSGYDPCYAADNWRSYDGGKTYHFVGYDLDAGELSRILYLINGLSPDDMYFTVEDGEIVSFTTFIDPSNYNRGTNQKYGRRIVSTFTERGTASIEALEPYAHEDFHDQIATVIENMANLKSYKATYNFQSLFNGEQTFIYTFTPDTVDVVVKQAGRTKQHTGAHVYQNSDGYTYYSYDYNDETKELKVTELHDTAWDNDTVHRYPTFNFAAEIFVATANPNEFVTRAAFGAFVQETIYASWYGVSCLDVGKIKIDGDYITEVSTTTTITDEDDSYTYNLRVAFSEFNETSIDIDFDTAIFPTTPTNWQDGSAELFEDMQAWNIPELPYLHPEEGWTSYITRDSDDPTHASFTTDSFSKDELRDQYIEDYQQLLLSSGWIDTNTTDADGNKLYQKGDYQVSVGLEIGWWSSAPTGRVQINVYSNLLTPN